MRHNFSNKAFTLAEMLVTLFTVGILGGGLALFSFTSTRFVSRNLATNHSHEATLVSAQSLLKELRDSASSFRQFTYDGTTTGYTDITPTGTVDVDALTGQYAGTRTNGVRYRQIYAGPLKMTSNAAATTTTLTFNFPSGTPTPIAGDKLMIPLISEEFDITAASGGTTKTITLGGPVGFTLNATSPNNVTGYFYRRVAFTVWDNELRYHPNFNGSNRSTYRVVRRGVTSPKPFSLLFPSATGSVTDALSIRVSMEITDLGYSSRKFGNGTTTLYSVIPARNQPTVLSTTN